MEQSDKKKSNNKRLSQVILSLCSCYLVLSVGASPVSPDAGRWLRCSPLPVVCFPVFTYLLELLLPEFCFTGDIYGQNTSFLFSRGPAYILDLRRSRNETVNDFTRVLNIFKMSSV